MQPKQKKKSTIRGFERKIRIQRLVEAGIITSEDDIPKDAIPMDIQQINLGKYSYSLGSRPPYYSDLSFTCSDCGQQSVWTADEQRYWYEQLHGSPYSTAKRCAECRKIQKGQA